MKKIILIIFITSCKIFSIDNPHFYRASHFFEEPRISKDNLSTLDIWLAAGKTTKGLNCHGNQTNILNIYGNDDIKFLTKNVPDCIADKFKNTILSDLWQKNTGNAFGQLKFLGRFSTVEFDIEFYQNFIHGFFAQIYCPVRKLQINHIHFKDLSTPSNAGPEINFLQWKRFLTHMSEMLDKVDINLNSRFKHTGVGDLSLLGGWSCNYQETKHLDYIDTTVKFGILFPTGRTANINNLFDLPQGYNGHYGVGTIFDTSVGIFDWFTVGFHAGALFFIDRTENVRMKTSKEQNGFIKLTKGTARVKKGTIWNVGCFIKADHVAGGLSILLGYRFDKENKTILNPCNLKTFNPNIVNDDRILNGWQMHTINLYFDYDFATIECPCLPKICILFDLPVGGKQIFKTKMIGGYIEFNYGW